LCKPCHRIAGMEVAPKLTLLRPGCAVRTARGER
jgi:hypothetical protein